jgi:ribosomal protein S12 methylthiotransferase accessory factor
LRRSFRSHAAGKGVTDVQARASALCEALERYSGQLQGDEPGTARPFASLAIAASIPTPACSSATQYRRRDEWNARPARLSRARALRRNGRARLDAAVVLTHARTRYLPLAYCYYGAGEQIGNRWMVANSNGAAAGNNLEEAVCKGSGACRTRRRRTVVV